MFRLETSGNAKRQIKEIQPGTTRYKAVGLTQVGRGDFSSPSNWPISTRGADYDHHSTTSPPRVFRTCDGPQGALITILNIKH